MSKPFPFRNLLCPLLAWTWLPAVSLAQSASPSSQPQPAQQSQSQSQPQTQPQASAQQKEDSVAEAARKAKERKAASTQGKVFTEDDLSGMRKEGVSVVGSENKKTAQPARIAAPEADYDPNSEQYWRKKARPILDEIAAVNRQIEQLKEDSKKYGNAGFDVSRGMKDGVAYVLDRNTRIEKLEKRKTALEKQLDDLQEEGRKAGAEPAWFR